MNKPRLFLAWQPVAQCWRLWVATTANPYDWFREPDHKRIHWASLDEAERDLAADGVTGYAIIG